MNCVSVDVSVSVYYHYNSYFAFPDCGTVKSLNMTLFSFDVFGLKRLKITLYFLLTCLAFNFISIYMCYSLNDCQSYLACACQTRPDPSLHAESL